MADFKARLCEALGLVGDNARGSDDVLIGRICRVFGAVDGPHAANTLPKRSDPMGISGPTDIDFLAFHKLQRAIEEGRLPDQELADALGIPGGVWSWQEVARQMCGIAERESMRAADGPLHYFDLQKKLQEVAAERDHLEARVAELEAAQKA